MARARSKTPGFAALRDGPLKTGEFGPVYVLVGEDQLRAEAVVEAMRRQALDPAAAAFNETVLHGDQTTWPAVLQAAQGFPMVGDRQLVWVRHLEALDRAKDDRGQKALVDYLAAPALQTLLVLTGEKVDGRKAWVAAAKKRGYVYAFDAPAGRELAAWIERAARRAGLTLDAAGSAMLAELVGNDLRALAAEIEKLGLVEESRGRPLAADELPGLVMDQASLEVFELTDHMVEGRPGEVLRSWWRLQSWGSDAYKLTPLAASHLRRVALAAAALEEGLTPEEVSARAGLNAWLLKAKLATHARRLSAESVRRLLAACLDCERSQKQRPVPPDIAFEQLLLTVATSDPADG